MPGEPFLDSVVHPIPEAGSRGGCGGKLVLALILQRLITSAHKSNLWLFPNPFRWGGD